MSNNIRNKFILIGLGNFNRKYASTRHNAGKMLAAYLRRHPVEGLEVSETDCYMNQSGEFVKRIVQKNQLVSKTVEQYNGKTVIGKTVTGKPVNRPTDYSSTVLPLHRSTDPPPSIPSFPKLIIAHDDLDLKLGEWKIHFGRGPRLHQGILSIEQALRTKDFWRVRIGIDNRLSVAVARPETYSSGGGGEARIGKRQAASAIDEERLTPYDTGLANATVKRFPKRASQTQPLARTINRPSGENYVLQPFKRQEKLILLRTFGLIKPALLEHVTKSVRSDVDSDLIASDSIATEEI